MPSAPAKKYNVTIPRTYKDAGGNQKTHFWHVGTAFPLKEREGFSVKLYSKMLLTDQFVIFPHEPEENGNSSEVPPEDDIPF